MLEVLVTAVLRLSHAALGGDGRARPRRHHQRLQRRGLPPPRHLLGVEGVGQQLQRVGAPGVQSPRRQGDGAVPGLHQDRVPPADAGQAWRGLHVARRRLPGPRRRSRTSRRAAPTRSPARSTRRSGCSPPRSRTACSGSRRAWAAGDGAHRTASGRRRRAAGRPPPRRLGGGVRRPHARVGVHRAALAPRRAGRELERHHRRRVERQPARPVARRSAAGLLQHRRWPRPRRRPPSARADGALRAGVVVRHRGRARPPRGGDRRLPRLPLGPRRQRPGDRLLRAPRVRLRRRDQARGRRARAADGAWLDDGPTGSDSSLRRHPRRDRAWRSTPPGHAGGGRGAPAARRARRPRRACGPACGRRTGSATR